MISEVLATVGVPPTTVTAPPLTRIVPAALRLIVIVLLRLSPLTASTPLLKLELTAALAGTLVTASTPTASSALASSPRSASWGLVTSCLHRRLHLRLVVGVLYLDADGDASISGRMPALVIE